MDQEQLGQIALGIAVLALLFIIGFMIYYFLNPPKYPEPPSQNCKDKCGEQTDDNGNIYWCGPCDCTPDKNCDGKCGVQIDPNCGEIYDCGPCDDSNDNSKVCKDKCGFQTNDDGQVIDCGKCDCDETQNCENSCGVQIDGCGNVYDCGPCGCVAVQNCEQSDCGIKIDNCGNSYYCGPCECEATRDCTGKCGTQTDDCGQEYYCGDCNCISEQDCTDRVCGRYLDNCNREYICGSCPENYMCADGECVCAETAEETCQRLNKTCGNGISICGETIDCGSCTAPAQCVNGNCDCISDKSCNGKACDETFTDKCGTDYTCPCPNNYKCENGECICAETAQETCDRLGKNCGSVKNRCNETVQCGSCTSPDTCQNGVCGCISDKSCNGKDCGTTYTDQCGDDYTCPCGTNEVCEDGECVCQPGYEDYGSGCVPEIIQVPYYYGAGMDEPPVVEAPNYTQLTAASAPSSMTFTLQDTGDFFYLPFVIFPEEWGTLSSYTLNGTPNSSPAATYSDINVDGISDYTFNAFQFMGALDPSGMPFQVTLEDMVFTGSRKNFSTSADSTTEYEGRAWDPNQYTAISNPVRTGSSPYNVVPGFFSNDGIGGLKVVETEDAMRLIPQTMRLPGMIVLANDSNIMFKLTAEGADVGPNSTSEMFQFTSNPELNTDTGEYWVEYFNPTAIATELPFSCSETACHFDVDLVVDGVVQANDFVVPPAKK